MDTKPLIDFCFELHTRRWRIERAIAECDEPKWTAHRRKLTEQLERLDRHIVAISTIAHELEGEEL